MSASLAPSPSSGFPPRLCNITAIIPIMTQFEALYPRHYPTASGSRLRIRCGRSCRRRSSVEYWKNADIFPRSIFSTESENHLKKSNESPPPRPTFRPHTLTWWSPADQCRCSVAVWYFAVTFRKPIFSQGQRASMYKLRLLMGRRCKSWRMFYQRYRCI